jgi:hypothetical protein
MNLVGILQSLLISQQANPAIPTLLSSFTLSTSWTSATRPGRSEWCWHLEPTPGWIWPPLFIRSCLNGTLVRNVVNSFILTLLILGRLTRGPSLLIMLETWTKPSWPCVSFHWQSYWYWFSYRLSVTSTEVCFLVIAWFALTAAVILWTSFSNLFSTQVTPSSVKPVRTWNPSQVYSET